METGWFMHEVSQRTKHCGFPPLVTTCTDGENGGWFRNTSPQANFWPVFYRNLMKRVRDDESGGIRPCFIDDYLDRHGAHGEVTVRPGAWNTGWHHGAGFTQWVSSPAQQQALTRVDEISQAIHAARRNATGISVGDPEVYQLLEQAHWRVLRAETSCNFFWGDAWLTRCHDDLNEATCYLDQAWARITLSVPTGVGLRYVTRHHLRVPVRARRASRAGGPGSASPPPHRGC